MSGPPPKDPKARRRRNPTPGFRSLPFTGREGEAPEWPLPFAGDYELKMWKRLWALPQALEWERMRCEDSVALYVRTYCAAVEDPENTKLMAEVRQLDAKIGLSPKAMKDMRWEIDDAEAVAPATTVLEEPEPEPQPDNVRVFVPRKQA